MNNKYIKDIRVDYTEVDRNLKLDTVSSMCIVQNNMTEFFEQIGSDNITVKNKNNAAWVVSKLKMHFTSYPIWKDEIIATSFVSMKSKIRTNLDTKVTDKYGNIIIAAKQEACPIDLTNRRIRKLDTINFPMDIEIEETVIDESFEKINTDDITEENYIYTRKVYSIDTDFTHHTNNVQYARFIAETLDSEFYDNNHITDLEIHYVGESFEHDELKIYKKVEGNSGIYVIRKDDKDIIVAKGTFRKKLLLEDII